MKKLIVIKFGGSIITNKDSRKPEAKIEIIKRLSQEIGQIYKQNKYQLIIVHGAGSFAHPLVKKYNLHLEVKSAEQKKALKKVHRQLLKLHSLVTDSLTKNQIPIASFPPRNLITQTNGSFWGFAYSKVKKALAQGFVPVLFGDMVPDSTSGYSVISGDTIVSYLARKLKANQVIFLTDVDGIYTEDPRINKTAKLIPKITNHNFNKVINNLTSTERIDVTGEMKGKLISLRRMLRRFPVMVLNGLKPLILQKALKPISVGTKILLN